MNYIVWNNQTKRLYSKLPKGYKINELWTCPSGFIYVTNGETAFKKGKNGKRIFNPKFKDGFIEENWHKKMTIKQKYEWHIGHPLKLIKNGKIIIYGNKLYFEK